MSQRGSRDIHGTLLVAALLLALAALLIGGLVFWVPFILHPRPRMYQPIEGVVVLVFVAGGAVAWLSVLIVGLWWLATIPVRRGEKRAAERAEARDKRRAAEELEWRTAYSDKVQASATRERIRRVYDESLFEELVRDFPKAFLKEDLSPLTTGASKMRIGGLIPDIIFRTKEGTRLIVEVQVGNLDRHHLYKSLEYRDLARLEWSSEPRLMIVVNGISGRLRELTALHEGLEIVVVSKHEVIRKARILKPNLEISG